MDDSTVLDLIPTYALGTLSEVERTRVEALLARSEEARRLLFEYEQILDGLALSVPARHAPTGSTDAFMARLRQYEHDSAAAPAESRREPPKIEPMRRRRTTLVLAAAALVLIVAGVGLWRWSVVSRQNTLVAAILNNPAVQAIALQPTGPNGQGTFSVVLYSTPDGSDAVLDRKSLPALPAGKQYQMWVIPKGKSPIGLPAFDPAPSNQPDQTTLLIHLPGPLSSYQEVALTVEPSGGSSQPTTQPIAAATIPG